MKLFSFSFIAVIVLLFGYRTIKQIPDQVIDKEAYNRAIQKKRNTAIRCSVDWSSYELTDEEIEQMIPLPGTGSHSWKISTTNDSAQFYFNQGINLYYGFHILEALPSFKKAQTFDPDCAMLYWAEALAYGPNINDYGYAASPEALIAVQKAKQLMENAAPRERGLIDAMEVRYAVDSALKRAALNEQYAEKMEKLYAKYPTNPEIGALYVDALMNLHPWDLWGHGGKAKPWTPQIVSLLENILKNAPDHPGANHYYIHAIEASPFAGKATASAELLGSLAPGLSHVVHMPSHIYIRTGQYEKGINVNVAALISYRNFKNLYEKVADNAFLYDYHNRHMQAACSINGNDYTQAIKDALDCQNSIDTSLLSLEAPVGNYVQYLYMTPQLTLITFKKWNEILNAPAISRRYNFAALLQEFGRGMAYANTGELPNARAALSEIESLLSEPGMSVVMEPFNSALGQGTVAKYILMGSIAEAENNPDSAVQYYENGVAAEDALVYQEPRDWLLPARHYLGNALLKQKKYKEAEKVFLKDLTYQPKNYISTIGLEKARR